MKSYILYKPESLGQTALLIASLAGMRVNSEGAAFCRGLFLAITSLLQEGADKEPSERPEITFVKRGVLSKAVLNLIYPDLPCVDGPLEFRKRITGSEVALVGLNLPEEIGGKDMQEILTCFKGKMATDDSPMGTGWRGELKQMIARPPFSKASPQSSEFSGHNFIHLPDSRAEAFYSLNKLSEVGIGRSFCGIVSPEREY